PRERHLHHGADAARGDALPGRGRRPPRFIRGHLRHGDHHQPHQPRVLLARHRSAERAQGMTVLLALVLVPLILAALAYLTPSSRVRPWLVPAGGVAHAVLT